MQLRADCPIFVPAVGRLHRVMMVPRAAADVRAMSLTAPEDIRDVNEKFWIPG